MIQIGDKVQYGVHGVCTVEEIVVRRIGDKNAEYYVLKPYFDHGSTVYIPKNNEVLVSKMKRVMTIDEIDELLRIIPDEELLWIENESDRRKLYNEIFNLGDRRQIMRLIKTLYARQQKRLEQKKGLLMSDEKYLKDAERILYDEFAYVLQIDRDRVLSFITEYIERERKKP